MDVDAILAVSVDLNRNADQLNQALREIDNLTRRASDVWRGPDVAQFQGRWEGQFRRAGSLAAQQLRELAETARRNAEEQRTTSDTLGDVAGPARTDVARSAFTGAAFGRLDRGWGSDGMAGGRQRTDDTVDLRDLPGENFDNDWAGRAILGRYLDGGDDWTIANEPTWTSYMESNAMLTAKLAANNDEQARAALQAYLTSGRSSDRFATTTSMEMENGESIIGYQYLHGTDANVGGFQHSGSTNVVALPDGTYQVTITSDYVWNDRIDPNPIYSTDRTKSMIAEIITLGRADPYDIHIGWSGTTTVIMDANGQIISGQGWPK